MKNATKIISCYSADTAGVCSALYELGGMVVVHDASGCNSTYSTHDEPRWYDKRSKIYISALTEMDAIMGNDKKLISDIVSAAADQNPAFIAVCGSPMPMMTGVDFGAVAQEIERRTGIFTFAVDTNGTHNYLKGASDALLTIVEKYTQKTDRIKNGVNILGATPLDIPLNGNLNSIKNCLKDSGFEVIASMTMDCTLGDIKRSAAAEVNLVVSYSGIAAAEFMLREYNIPYVCGVPVGGEFSKILADSLKNVKEKAYPCSERQTAENGIYIIGEGISAGSLASAITLETGEKTRVVCPLDHNKDMLAQGDSDIYAEEDIEKLLVQNKPKAVIADPLYKFIVPKDIKFIDLPHFAFSGRCYERFMPNLADDTFIYTVRRKL